jgi:hypothetical protein
MTLEVPNISADIVGEKVLNLGGDGDPAFVARATDPVILPQPYVTPGDFAAQFPQPLDTTEILAMCEEITVWQALPELPTALKGETWRELNELAFTSGSAYISFADGECPEEYEHDGNNTTVNLKNIGAKKTLSISDIMHSAAVAAADWNGINRILGGIPTGEGVPGGSDTATFLMETIADVKDKEVRLAMTLVLNGWDNLLVNGDAASNSLEFTGFGNWFDQGSCSGAVHRNDGDWAASGAFTSESFDRFLSEACAKPTHIFGAPQSVQEMLSDYFQLGYQGSQLINFASGDRIIPGFNFAGFVNTGVGRLAVVADNNIPRADAGGGNFQSNLYAFRMTHNGVPLVYKRTQIPLAMKDLAPGCTAVSFQIWAKTALIIKHCCAHGVYTGNFTGRIVTTCPTIG